MMILFGSLAIGLIFGIFSALITKYSRFLSHNPVLEVTTVFFIGYVGYLLSEYLKLSGVLSVLVSGIFMN